jgi:hypothetical protein
VTGSVRNGLRAAGDADEPLAFELSETGRELLADEYGEAA